MSDGDDPQATRIDPPPVSEFTELAQLAFASREIDAEHSLAARNLVFLSPDALDMDLSDPMQRDFGDYELLEKIGQGGMGVVYRAHQRSLDREVALKLLIAGPWAPPKFIERFQLEAQSAARLEHPNIVTVYEGGSQQDLHYFSMRLVRGEALSAVLRRRKKLPPREAAETLRVVADAVDYAHRLGVLHLDLKPGNVLIDATGEPLVADFGLARRLDEALADPAGDASGTPSYMAPEQADAKHNVVGRATDIYGLGCILYETLCGEPPFSGVTAQATLKRVLRDEVESPRKRDASIPKDLEAICLKCLSKNPAERYQSAADLSEDLRSFLDDRSVSVRQPPVGERARRWIRREPRLAAAVAGVAGALVIGLAATVQQWQRAEDNAFAARQLIWEGRREAAFRLERDGRGLEAWDELLSNLTEQETAGALDQAELERVRIGWMRDQGARLIDTIVVPDARPIASAVSPGGKLLAAAFVPDLTLRWYDTADLEERGRVELENLLAPDGLREPWRTSDGAPRAPRLLRFVDEERLLVTLDWIGNRVRPNEADTWLVDTEHGSVVMPPEGHTVAAYSPNAEWALLARDDGPIELWRTVPWTRVSEVGDSGAQDLGWLLTNDGRSAFSLGSAMRGLRWHDLTDDDSRLVAVPGDAGISAWMLSGDGRHLALGDFSGSVFLLDTASLELRQLPVQRGREITWLAFSEDDAWLATAEFDGLVQVVDLSGGDLLIGTGMRAEFQVNRVGISRQERLLIAAGEGRTALWRIPYPGVRTRPAGPIGTAPAEHEEAGPYPIGWSVDTGLLASAGLDGQVRLWRLPRSPSMSAKPARQIPEALRHDDGRVIDIEWNRLRLVSPEGRALTDWLELAQPPGYAQLLQNGRILLVTVGAELNTYDTNALRPRHLPVRAPSTPERLLASPDGRFVMLSFGAHGDFGHEERLRLFDAVAGSWLPGEAVLDGPVERYLFSPDMEWILAVGQPLGVTTVLRSDGLEVVNEYVHDPYEPIIWADFDGSRLLLLAEPDPATQLPSSLVVWDPETGDDERYGLGAARPEVVVATRDGYGLFGNEYDLYLDADGRSRRLPRAVTTAEETLPTAALSADGRFLARAVRNEVQLHDGVTGELILGLPLYADIRTLGGMTRLAFSSHGRALRGDDLFGVNLQWPLHAETASIEAQRSELARLLPEDGDDSPLFAPTAAERRRLRAADPGPWLPAETRPPIPLASDSLPGVTIPARDSATPPWLVDLGPVYNRSPWEIRNTFFDSMSRLTPFPVGILHLAGVDFDVRGMAQLGLRDNSADATPQRLECLRVPAIRASAFHLLVHSGLETPAASGMTLAELTLHYADGTEERLPLRAGFELMGYNFDDSLVPIVFATEVGLPVVGGPYWELGAPRLRNPHPERLIECLDVVWLGQSGSLELLAVTLEPAEEGSAVIGAGQFR